MISTPFADVTENNGLRRTEKRNQWHNANSLWVKKALLTTVFWTNQQQICIKQYFHETKNSCCRSLHHAEDNLPNSPNKKMEVTGWLAKKYNMRINLLLRKGANKKGWLRNRLTGLTLSWRRPISYRNQSIDLTGFYMTSASVMKGLKSFWTGKTWFKKIIRTLEM